MRYIAVVLATLLVAATISSCLPMEQRLRGRWVARGMMGMGGDLEFSSDGTYTWDQMFAVQKGTWRMQKRTLYLKMTSYTFDKEMIKQMGMEQQVGDLPTDLMQDMKGMPTPEIACEIVIKGKELQLTMEGVTLHFDKES